MTARRLHFDIRQAGRVLMLVLGTGLALNLLGYLLLVRPEVREYRAIMGGTDERQVQLKTKRERVEAREAYVAKLHKAQTDLKDLRTGILATRERRLVEVQRELERLCGEFRILLDSVAYDNEPLREEGLDRFVMVVPLEGGYAALRKFLQAVESSDKFLVVERVALGEGQQGGVQLLLNITLATYFDLPEDERGRGPQSKRRGTRRA